MNPHGLARKENNLAGQVPVAVWWWLGFFVAGSLPILTPLLLRLPVLGFDNFTDSVFYLAYSRDFTELVLRHGFIYYVTRFGVIFPEALSYWIFGEVVGVVLLRLALGCGVCLALYAVFSKWGGPLAGIFAAVLWAFHPVAARLQVTTYLDSLAVPLLLIGICLWARGPNRVLVSLGIGALFALVISAHLYLILMLTLLLPFVAGARWTTWKQCLLEALWILFGGILTFAAAWAYYYAVWKMPDLWSPTAELMRGMSDGDTEKWKLPLADSLRAVPVWFAPFPVLILLIAVWFRSSTLLKGATISLLGATALFWAGDLIGGAYALSMPFYFSFLLPAVILALAALGIEALKKNAVPWVRWFVFVGLIGVVLGLALTGARLPIPSSIVVGWSILVGVLLVFAVVLWKFESGKKIVCVLLVVGVSQNLAFNSSFFGQFFGAYRIHQPAEEQFLWLASQLRDVVPGAEENGRIVRFWYDDREAGDLRTLQSFYLHKFSKLAGVKDGFADYPQLHSGDAEVIRSSGVGAIFLLDHDEDRMAEALASLENNGLPVSIRNKGVLSAKKRNIHFLHLDLEHPVMEDRIKLSLQDLEAGSGAGLARMESGLRLRTRDRKWNFDGKLELASERLPTREIRSVVFRGRLASGRVLLSVLGEEPELPNLASAEIWPTEGEVERFLQVPEWSNPELLVISNLQPDGSRSILFIRNISVEPK